MDRQELIGLLDVQAKEYRENNNMRLKDVRDIGLALESTRDNLAAEDDAAAVEGAMELKRLVIRQGGIVKAQRIHGKKGWEDVVIYASEGAKRNYQYACGLVERVREVTGIEEADEVTG